MDALERSFASDWFRVRCLFTLLVRRLPEIVCAHVQYRGEGEGEGEGRGIDTVSSSKSVSGNTLCRVRFGCTLLHCLSLLHPYRVGGGCRLLGDESLQCPIKEQHVR